MLRSIRWQLPISYGILALLTASSLGAVLLLLLRGHYIRLERLYLEQNAAAAITLIEPLLNATEPFRDSSALPLVESQINTLAFISQTKIRLEAPDGSLIVESGDPLDLQAITTFSMEVATDDAMQTYRQTLDASDPEAISSLLIIDSKTGRFERATNARGDIAELGLTQGIIGPLALFQTPTSLGLGGLADPLHRSEQVLARELKTPSGDLQGLLLLSQGPAFGRPILITVTWGLILAGGVAFLLAAMLGWMISWRLNRPIQGLAEATRTMAAGDLAVQAAVSGPDELRQLAAAFNAMGSKIGATVATLRQFVADAAHELNTPLTALRTNLDLAAKSAPEDVHLRRALEQTGRLQKLASDLLSLSRLESGLNDMAREPVELTSLLKGRSEVYAAQAEQAGLEYRIELPAGPLIIQGDIDLLRRVTDNLVDNAIKFTPAGGGVALEMGTSNGRVILQVKDTGVGIPREDVDLVFNRFHRGRNSSGVQGSGLGLAIVRHIVHLHRGEITVHTEQTGTRFTIAIPLLGSRQGKTA